MSNNSPSHTQVIQLNDADGWEFRPVYKNRRQFSSIPLIRSGLSQDRQPDLLDLLGGLSKKARDLFLEIKCNMKFTDYIAVLPNQGLTQSQRNKRSHAINELERTGGGLARRVPQSGIKNNSDHEIRFPPSTFMLSPNYIFPADKYSDEIHTIWRQCGTQRSRKPPLTP